MELSPVEQQAANIERIKTIYIKIKHQELLARIFEDNDKVTELDFETNEH